MTRPTHERSVRVGKGNNRVAGDMRERERVRWAGWWLGSSSV